MLPTKIHIICTQSESFVQTPAQATLVPGNANPAIHGSGPIQVSLPSFSLLLDQLVVKASKALGGRFPFNLDMQSGNMIGFSKSYFLLSSNTC